MKCPDTPKSVIAKLIRKDGEKDRVWNKSWNIFYEIYYDLINAMVVNSFAQFGCAGVPPDDIVETTSDVFMSLIKSFESGAYKPGEYHFRGFLKLIAKRRTLDHLRKKSNVKSIPIESIDVIDALARENAQSRKFFDKLEEDELKLYKPDPAFFRYALNDAGIKAEETLFIDDSQTNLDSASSVGIHTMLARTDVDWTQEMAELLKI